MPWTARIAHIGPAYGGALEVTLDITDDKATHQHHILVEADATEEDVRRTLRDTLRALAPALDGAAAKQALIGMEETL